MRVPEARSTARVGIVSTPRASAEAFGAGVARGIQEVGGQVTRIGGMAMELAVEQKRQRVIREAEDGYSSWLRQANEISNTEVFSKAGAQTDHLLDDDESPENSGFNTNYTSKLDKAFSDVSENLSPNAKQRLGVMVQNQRLAFETRARNHVFTQQNEAAKSSAKVAVAVSQESAAQQARAYTKKQPDGTVNVAWPEIDRLMGDVISAQSIYNARTGTPNEITLPDGTKKNVLAETARAGAHQKAIDTLMAAGEYDEAQAYLDGITAEKRPDGSANPYLNDFDGKQVKATADTIRKWRNAQQQQAESNEVIRLQSDQFSGKIALDTPTKELSRLYPNLPKSMLVQGLVSEANAAAKAAKEPPAMTPGLVRDAIADIAKTDVTPENSVMLARKLDALGFKKETDTAVWKVFNQKFNPSEASGAIGDNAPFYAIEKERLTRALATANEKGWGRRFDIGTAEKDKPTADKLSDFYSVLTRETVAMDSFVESRIKKGLSYDQAVSEYWEQPRMKKIKDEQDISAVLDVALSPVENEKQRAKAAAGLNVLTNTAASVQSSFYIDPAQLMKLNVPVKY